MNLRKTILTLGFNFGMLISLETKCDIKLLMLQFIVKCHIFLKFSLKNENLVIFNSNFLLQIDALGFKALHINALIFQLLLKNLNQGHLFELLNNY